MPGQRVLVIAMGADLASRVASLPEAGPGVGSILAIAINPRRRRRMVARRTAFTLVSETGILKMSDSQGLSSSPR